MPSSNIQRDKFFRDPVHDIIKFSKEDSFLLDIIDSTPFQRLRRIKQLGFVDYVYPGAQHSRFSHSLGSYFLANKVIQHLNSSKEIIDSNIRKLILTAALLHDIGHGPFSHIFESVLKELNQNTCNHENWGKKIIEESNLKEILLEKGKIKIQGLKEIFDKTFTPKIAFSIISSQFDVDRLDYLLRDSIMTGCKYARIDLEWIMRNLVAVAPDKSRPNNLDIAIDGSRGISAIDQYLLGRFHNYKHIVYHKTVRAAEMMFKRILVLGLGNGCDRDSLISCSLEKIALKEPLTVEDYLSLDDNIIMTQIKHWAHSSKNETLKDLCDRLINRKLFKAVYLDIKDDFERTDTIQKIRDYFTSRRKDHHSYFLSDQLGVILYKDIVYYDENNEEGSEILYIDKAGDPKRLSVNTETLVRRDKSSLAFLEKRFYIPVELKNDIEKIIEGI